MTIGRPSGRRALSVTVAPAPGANHPDAAAALLLITDPESAPVPPPALLGAMYGLTGAESAVVLRLVQGESLRDAAQHLRMAYETARTHPKRALRKTGARTQADLVRIVVAGPLGASAELMPHG